MKTTKKKQKKKVPGFTLVELLAVIVILAIIMLISIPNVLQSMQVARRRGFITFGDKSYKQALQTYGKEVLLDDEEDDESDCIIYNIKHDLGLSNTGDYDGWILLNVKTDDAYITLYDNEFALIAYHYSDSSLKMNDYIINRNNVNIEELTTEYLCNKSNCQTCKVTEQNPENKDNYIYRFSFDRLQNGDRIDLNNRKYTKYTKYDEDTFEPYAADETHDMDGIYSSDINDVLKFSKLNGYSLHGINENNVIFLKHTVDVNGIITKTENCLKTPWGLICIEGADGINDETNHNWNDPYKWHDQNFETKKDNLLNFFKWNLENSTSEYDGVACQINSHRVDCNVSYLNIGIAIDQSGIVVSYDDSNGKICEIYNGIIQTSCSID